MNFKNIPIKHRTVITKEELLLLKLNGIDWINIITYNYLDEQVIEYFKDEINWKYLYENQKFSERFIEKYVSCYDNESEMYWTSICQFQELSERFIEKYADYVNWYCISKYQNLTLNFIIKHMKDIHWLAIHQNENLSNELKNELKQNGIYIHR